MSFHSTKQLLLILCCCYATKAGECDSLFTEYEPVSNSLQLCTLLFHLQKKKALLHLSVFVSTQLSLNPTPSSKTSQ